MTKPFTMFAELALTVFAGLILFGCPWKLVPADEQPKPKRFVCVDTNTGKPIFDVSVLEVKWGADGRAEMVDSNNNRLSWSGLDTVPCVLTDQTPQKPPAPPEAPPKAVVDAGPSSSKSDAGSK